MCCHCPCCVVVEEGRRGGATRTLTRVLLSPSALSGKCAPGREEEDDADDDEGPGGERGAEAMRVAERALADAPADAAAIVAMFADAADPDARWRHLLLPAVAAEVVEEGSGFRPRRSRPKRGRGRGAVTRLATSA